MILYNGSDDTKAGDLPWMTLGTGTPQKVFFLTNLIAYYSKMAKDRYTVAACRR